MKKLWLKDFNFLLKNAKDNQNSNDILRLLNKIELTKEKNRDYYILNLNEIEMDLIEDFLTDLIGEFGIGEDGEINQTGRYVDDLIDIFNTRS